MVYTPNFYNAADQKIYNDGTYFKPQERFTLPYNQIPTDDENSVEPEGILSANVVNNGNQFSVYNPDPNTISNSNYNEDPYKSYLYRDRFPMMGDPVANQATGALNADGIMSYAGDKPQSKFLEMLSQGINLIPGADMAKKGLEYLGDMLPTNRRAIFENELAGQGVRVNNIGQIVQGQGDYNTAENIMAGYNASKIDADTYKKRRDMINETIERKLKADPTYDRRYLDNRLTALDASEESILGTATDRANIIYADDEEEKNKNKNKKNKIINRYITKKKETKTAKDAQDIVDVEAVKAAIKKAEAATTNSGGFTYDTNTTGQASSNQYGTYTPSVTPQQAQDNQDRGRGQQDTESQTNSQAGSGGFYDEYNKGGRVGYFFGGLAAKRMKR